jgi:hypothetical protein
VFKNSVLRRINGAEREEVTKGCKTLHSEELHYFKYSSVIIMVIKKKGG